MADFFQFMADSIQSLWMLFMRILYDPGGTLVFAFSALISIVTACFSVKDGEYFKKSGDEYLYFKKGDEDNSKKYAVRAAVITILLAIGIWHSKDNYTYMPEINFDSDLLGNVLDRLSSADLKYDLAELNYDAEAIKHYTNETNLFYSHFVVTDSSFEPNKFLKKGTKIILSVSWYNAFEMTYISEYKSENFDPAKFYGNSGSAEIHNYNISNIELKPLPVGAKAIVKGSEQFLNTVYSPVSEKSIVTGCLVDYFTNKIVKQAICRFGDSIFFSDIPEGTYYFFCYCDGYKWAASKYLFRIHYDPSLASEINYSLYWEEGLEKKDSYSQNFKIRLVNEFGDAYSNKLVRMRVIDENDYHQRAALIPEYITNESGYLCNPDSWHSMSGGILEFQICDGYFAEISLSSQNSNSQNYVPVPIPDGSEVCITIK